MENFVFNYQRDLAIYFEKQKKTWNWFASKKTQEDQRIAYTKELLKNTYRLSEDSEKKIYDLLTIAKDKLAIQNKVIVYQELDSFQTNARVSFDGETIHLVVSGELLKRLNEQELLAVISHELSHIKLFEIENGRYEVTERIINSIANDENSSAIMTETARLYSLYMELFCDRGALLVVDDMNIVVQALVKVSSGLTEISAENYIKQAKEIFETELTGSSGISHPETFLRALALSLWKEENAEEKIIELIDLNWGMNKLDIFKQEKLFQKTKKMLQIITKPRWIQTSSILSLGRQYMPDFQFSNEVFIDEDLKELLDNTDDTLNEYFSYILMDFCFYDSSLEKAPMGHAFQIASALNFHKTFRQILKKELKLTAKSLDAMISKSVSEVSELSESAEESILKED